MKQSSSHRLGLCLVVLAAACSSWNEGRLPTSLRSSFLDPARRYASLFDTKPGAAPQEYGTVVGGRARLVQNW